MSGKIELKVRLSQSRDPKYGKYPEAYLEVTDEENKTKKIRLSPRYRTKGKDDSIEEMLLAFRVHELKVDKTRDRKGYTSSLVALLEEIVVKLQQMKLSEFEEIEEIYFVPKKVSVNEKM